MINNYKEFKRQSLDLFVNSELKPCPWCGEEPSLSFADPGAPFPGGYYSIDCDNDNCMAQTEFCKKALAENELETVKELINNWNTRKNG